MFDCEDKLFSFFFFLFVFTTGEKITIKREKKSSFFEMSNCSFCGGGCGKTLGCYDWYYPVLQVFEPPYQELW